MTTTTKTPLTEDQKKALRAYKKAHGRHWRWKLNTDWMNAHVTGVADHFAHILYCLRNTHGPSWLADLKLRDFMRPAFQPVPAPFGGTGSVKYDERATTEAFEDYVGGSTRAFRLMNLWREAQQDASGNAYTFRKLPSASERFRTKALREGFEDEDVDAYLKL